MAFKGWPAEAVGEFYRRELQADNSKPYWQDHRPSRTVRAPRWRTARRTRRRIRPRQSCFRPYRDVRFSANKEPYQDQLRPPLGRGRQPGIRILLSRRLSGGGLYMTNPVTLQRFRTAVDREKSETQLAEIVDDPTKPGTRPWRTRCSRPHQRGSPGPSAHRPVAAQKPESRYKRRIGRCGGRHGTRGPGRWSRRCGSGVPTRLRRYRA